MANKLSIKFFVIALLLSCAVWATDKFIHISSIDSNRHIGQFKTDALDYASRNYSGGAMFVEVRGRGDNLGRSSHFLIFGKDGVLQLQSLEPIEFQNAFIMEEFEEMGGPQVGEQMYNYAVGIWAGTGFFSARGNWVASLRFPTSCVCKIPKGTVTITDEPEPEEP